MTTVFNLCKKLIEKGKVEGLQEKMDVYLACDRLTVEEYKEYMIKRANLETERYFNLYCVRKDDMNNYDLVVDTTNLTIEEVKQKILDEYTKWMKENGL